MTKPRQRCPIQPAGLVLAVGPPFSAAALLQQREQRLEQLNQLPRQRDHVTVGTSSHRSITPLRYLEAELSETDYDVARIPGFGSTYSVTQNPNL
jgi:hypothetical protein